MCILSAYANVKMLAPMEKQQKENFSYTVGAELLNGYF